jgi:hypothetical protein
MGLRVYGEEEGITAEEDSYIESVDISQNNDLGLSTYPVLQPRCSC